MLHCYHCDTALGHQKPFRYNDFDFCCECMAALCSWFLDGGLREDPEMFRYALTDTDASLALEGRS